MDNNYDVHRRSNENSLFFFCVIIDLSNKIHVGHYYHVKVIHQNDWYEKKNQQILRISFFFVLGTFLYNSID